MSINYDKLTNWVLLITCLLVGGGAVYDRVAAARMRALPPPSEATFLGRTVHVPVKPARKSDLLVYLRPGCSACEANMPFYRSLAGMKNRQFDFTVLGADQRATDAYLAANRVSPDLVAAADFAAAGVVATPTVLLTDANGRVTRAWVGTIMGEREQEFLRAVGQEPQSAGIQEKGTRP